MSDRVILWLHGAPHGKHALEIMKDLGITYQKAIPQSIIDGWEFLGCEGLPTPLPDYLKIVNLNVQKIDKTK